MQLSTFSMSSCLLDEDAMMLSALAFTCAVLGSSGHVYTLIVAENRPAESTNVTLRFADDDGVRYYELFEHYANRVELLAVLDDDTQRQHRGVAAKTTAPSRSNVMRAFERLNAAMAADVKAGASPVFYFIYTGHGGVDAKDEGFITLHDGKLTRTQLYESIVAKSAATYNHLIIDACDSYLFVSSRGDKVWKNDRRGAPQTAAVEAYAAAHTLERYPNTGVLLSTSKAAESHEWSRYGAGVFSHEVRSGLVGSADVNGDGRIEYSEIAAYVASANLGIDDPRARLEVFAKAPAQYRAEPLFDLAQLRTRALLRFDAQSSGRFEIEDDRGVRFADFNKAADAPVVVGVLPGRGYYVRRDTSETFIPANASGVISIAGSTWQARAIVTRDATSDAFAQHLYRTPYGPVFYSGYVATSGMEPVRTSSDRSFPSADVGTVYALEPRHELRPWAIGFAAAAGVTATAAVLTYALRSESTISTTTGNNGNGNGAGNGRKTTTTVESGSMVPTYVLGGIAVATGVTALVLFLKDGSSTSARTTTVAPLSASPLPGGGMVFGSLAF